MENQMAHHWEPGNNNSANPIKVSALLYTPENAVGASLFWIVPMFISLLVSSLINIFAYTNLPLHGYSDLPQIFTGLFTVAIFCVGLYFVYRSLRIYFDRRISLLAIIFLWLSTNLFYYSSIDVLNSHSISFFLSSLAIYFLLKISSFDDVANLIKMGLIMGLLYIVREQDILTVLPFFLIKYFQKNRPLIMHFRNVGVVLISFLIPLSVQISYNYQNFNTWIHPHFKTSQWNFPNLLSYFISPKRGSILFYSPSIMLATYGLSLMKISIKKIFILTIALQILISSAWNEGSSYGPRTLITIYPILIFGIAYLLKKKFPPMIFLILSVINFLMMFYFLLVATGVNSSGIDPVTLQRLRNMIEWIH